MGDARATARPAAVVAGPAAALARAGAALTLALALLAGCESTGPLRPVRSFGRTDFSNYAALGTSVSMGLASDGLVDTNQAAAVPALIAQQTSANADAGGFVQPLVAPPGIPPLLVVTSTDPLTLDRAPGTPPAGSYVPRPARGYDNLAVAGALIADAMEQTGGDPYFALVLQGHGSMVRQAIARRPTFLTVELGSTEALRPLLAGGDPALLIPPATFRTLYAQLLDSLAAGAPNALLAVSNVPRVTALPIAAAVPLDEVVPLGVGAVPTPVRLRDASGPLPDGSLILLTALPLLEQGYGLPDPEPPLPDSMVVTVAERTAIESAIDGYDAAIAAEAQARGLALVDEHALFEGLVARGVTVGFVHYTTAWPFGGLISLDGIHPTRLGSGVLANAFLTAINAQYGARLPLVDLRTLAVRPGPALAATP